MSLMTGWLLHKFNELRRELLAAGTFKSFCRELHALVSPDGALSLYEVIDSSGPEQWRAAVERVNSPGRGQLPLAVEVS